MVLNELSWTLNAPLASVTFSFAFPTEERKVDVTDCKDGMVDTHVVKSMECLRVTDAQPPISLWKTCGKPVENHSDK
jgi:hypothetical protein